jgi:hypothetical protein
LSLAARDLFDRGTELLVRPGFDLNKDDHPVIAINYVDLAFTVAKIGVRNFVAQYFDYIRPHNSFPSTSSSGR